MFKVLVNFIFNKWYNEGLCIYHTKKMPLNKLLQGLIPFSSIQKQNKYTTKNKTTKQKTKNLRLTKIV